MTEPAATGELAPPQNPLRVQVPATSANLGPGFDSFGLALDLYDEYQFAPAEELAISVEGGGGAEMVSLQDDNLAIAAARQLCARAGGEFEHLRLHEALRIPIQRGLGSSAGRSAPAWWRPTRSWRPRPRSRN